MELIRQPIKDTVSVEEECSDSAWLSGELCDIYSI